MSVQSEFLKSLFDELTARGISEDVARDNVTKFQSQLKKKAEVDGNDKIDAALSKIPPASIAENIYNMLKAEDDSEAGARSEVVVIDTENDTVTKTVKEGKDVLKKDALPEEEKVPEEPEAEEAPAEAAKEESTEVEEASEELTEASEEAEETFEEAEGATEESEAEGGAVVLDIPADDPSIEGTPKVVFDEDITEVASTEENEDAAKEAEDGDTAEEGSDEEPADGEESAEGEEPVDGEEEPVEGEEPVDGEEEPVEGEEPVDGEEEPVEGEEAIDGEPVEGEAAEGDGISTESAEAATDISDKKLDSIFGSDENVEEGEEENDDDLKVFRKPGEDLSEYEPNNRRRVHNAGRNSASQTPPGERKTVRRTTEALDLFDDEEKKKTSWLFYVFAIILVPLVFLIGAALFGVFLILWLAMAVLSTVLIVGVVALTAAGSLASICGLIFAIIELIGGNAPAAMFEAGLALTVGSSVLFVGILIYNLAVRFLPFIIKKLFALLILIFKMFGKMFRKFKQICASL